MGRLKLVSIGGFGHTPPVLDDLSTMPKADLVGLAPAYNGEDISGFLKLPMATDKRVFDNYKQMLGQLRPDVAIISTRLDVIPHVIVDSANSGCHIIVEKPLALDLTTLEKVRTTVKRNNVNLMAMLTMRSEPQFVAAKQVYDSGVIGEAVLVNGRKSYKWGTRPDWFGDAEKYGGTIGWVGIHAFDFINFVTSLDFTKISAMQGNFAHSERPYCQDNCAIIMELSNGGHGTITVDYCRPENADTHGDDWIRVVGTKGVIEASGAKKECSVISSDKGVYRQPLPDGKDKMFSRFLRNLIEGKSNLDIQGKSFMLTRVCLFAHQAASQGGIIEIC